MGPQSPSPAVALVPRSPHLPTNLPHRSVRPWRFYCDMCLVYRLPCSIDALVGSRGCCCVRAARDDGWLLRRLLVWSFGPLSASSHACLRLRFCSSGSPKLLCIYVPRRWCRRTSGLAWNRLLGAVDRLSSCTLRDVEPAGSLCGPRPKKDGGQKKTIGSACSVTQARACHRCGSGGLMW